MEQAVLEKRGLRSPEEIDSFLNRRYQGVTDPFAMRDMDRAVERLNVAHDSGEKVVVYGDYDADGATATALLYGVLMNRGFNAVWYIPDRFREGYGLNPSAISQLRVKGAELLISVDCGIRAVELVAEAKKEGLDTIITDHHLPGSELPPAVAVLNPARQDDSYPFKGLAGVGLAYKLAQGMSQSAGENDVQRQLDLVALGTITDLAPLVEENRMLVGAGLEQLNSSARPGLRALAEFAGYKSGAITASSVGFGLGPRLNAAGRLADAGIAVDLLLAKAGPAAWEQARRLDELNRERQQLTTETLEVANRIAKDQSVSDDLVLAFSPEFHEGVTGLVAGRLSDRLYRPALVGRIDGENIRGSARSIPEFHITEALEACADLLVRFGGHAQAAGFTLAAQDRPAFVERVSQIAADRLAGMDLRPSLEIDAFVDFSALDDELMAFIDRLQPCGMGNPYPVFTTANATVLAKRAVGSEKSHLKLSVRQGERVFDAIGFGLGDLVDGLPVNVDLAYRLERNDFRGVVSLQLNLQDVRAVSGSIHEAELQ